MPPEILLHILRRSKSRLYLCAKTMRCATKHEPILPRHPVASWYRLLRIYHRPSSTTIFHKNNCKTITVWQDASVSHQLRLCLPSSLGEMFLRVYEPPYVWF